MQCPEEKLQTERERERVRERESVGEENEKIERASRASTAAVQRQALLSIVRHSWAMPTNLYSVRMSGEALPGRREGAGKWGLRSALATGGDSDAGNAGVSVANARHCYNNKLPGLNFTCLYVCVQICMCRCVYVMA